MIVQVLFIFKNVSFLTLKKKNPVNNLKRDWILMWETLIFLNYFFLLTLLLFGK